MGHSVIIIYQLFASSISSGGDRRLSFSTADNFDTAMIDCYKINSFEEWKTRIFNRNNSVAAGETIAYFIDDNLAAKFAGLFESPSANEIDIWVMTKAYDKN